MTTATIRLVVGSAPTAAHSRPAEACHPCCGFGTHAAPLLADAVSHAGST